MNQKSFLRRLSRGSSIIESMISMLVISGGMLGLVSSQAVVAAQNHQAAKKLRGAAVARDIAAAVSRWPYDDTRLTNSNPDNDARVVGSEGSASDPAASGAGGTSTGTSTGSLYDVDLNNSSSGTNAPMEASKLDFNKDGQPDFGRFLTVSPIKEDGVEVGKRVAITVVWSEGGRYRKATAYTAKYNPAVNQANIPGL